MRNKYKANSLYLDVASNKIIWAKEFFSYPDLKRQDLLFFASIHEYTIYSCIQQSANNYFIQVQPKVEIIPKNKITSFPQGKVLKLDFLVSKDGSPEMLIEAKGKLTREFILKLALLELNNLELFNKLWLVFPAQLPCNQIIKNLQRTSMKKRILTRRQFQATLKNIIS